MSTIVETLKHKKNTWVLEEHFREFIGIEIKRKRLMLQYTLQALAIDICSPSYLCKIERNQIQANRYILEEVCRRVDITKDQQEILFNFYQVLMNSVHAYIYNDTDSIKKTVETGSGFENYRYRIVQLMYYLLEGDTTRAIQINSELSHLLDGMQDTDMLIFSLFSAILEYKEKNYLECYTILSTISDIHINEELEYLKNKFLYLSSNLLGSMETVDYYRKTKESLVRIGYYEPLEELHYSFALFCIKFKAENMLSEVLPLVHDKENKGSLEFLMDYKNQDIAKLKKNKKMSKNQFCLLLENITLGNKTRLEYISHLTSAHDDYDFNANILKYYCLSDLEERRTFILEALEKAIETHDRFTIKFFMEELTKVNLEKPHYKETIYAYYSCMEVL